MSLREISEKEFLLSATMKERLDHLRRKQDSSDGRQKIVAAWDAVSKKGLEREQARRDGKPIPPWEYSK